MGVAITNTQQGVITEAEFAKIAILTSNGRLVPTRALADDDRHVCGSTAARECSKSISG